MREAIWAALRFEWKHGSWSDLLWRAKGMTITWWRSRGHKLPKHVVTRRLDACQRCPLYCASRQTCGDALNPEWLGEGVPMGCFCHLPTKVKLPAATCWLDEQGAEGLRWPH